MRAQRGGLPPAQIKLFPRRLSKAIQPLQEKNLASGIALATLAADRALAYVYARVGYTCFTDPGALPEWELSRSD